MEVNIRAVSNALDALLEENAEMTRTVPRQKQNSAIIPRRQQQHSRLVAEAPLNDENATSMRRQISTAKSGEQAGREQPDSFSLAASTAELIMEDNSNQKYTRSSSQLRARTDSSVTSTPAEKEGRQFKHADRSPKKESSRKKIAASFTSGNETQKLFEQLRSVELLAVKPLEASGLGVASALVTPRILARRVDKAQLSSKSWVTNTLLAPWASAIFELENFPDAVEKHTTSLPLQYSSDGLQNKGHSVSQQDVAVLLLLDENSDRKKYDPLGRSTYSVSIESSNSRRRDFVAVSEMFPLQENLASLTIPGTLLKRYIRIKIKSTGDLPESNSIRVRALCFHWGATWTSKTVEENQSPASLEEEVEATIRDLGNLTDKAVSAEEVDFARDSSLREQRSMSGSTQVLLSQQERDRNSEGASKTAISNSREKASLAELVKDVALANLRREVAHQQVGENDESANNAEREYNWLSDEIESGISRKLSQLSLPLSGKADEEASQYSPPVTTALSEYVEILQAWNSAPLWRLEQAVEFCLAQTTSFSASTVLAEDLFNDTASFHLSQPFKVHFLIVLSPATQVEKSGFGVSTEATLPPLHSLSAIVGEAASCGYASELLFRCDFSGGFGCVLRPESAALRSPDERFKLIFVVSPSYQSTHSPEAADAAVLLLTEALTVFQKTESMRVGAEKLVAVKTQRSLPSVRQPCPPCGALRLLVDGTECFGRLAPILSQWSLAAGPVRYYGSASQHLLQMLLSPLQFAGLGSSAASGTKESRYNNEVQWSCLHIKTAGFWPASTPSLKGSGENIVALELMARDAVSYVWQSQTRERAALRLVLTDNHLLECVDTADGLILPSSATSLVREYRAVSHQCDTFVPPVASISEAPWEELLQSAKNAFDLFGAAAKMNEKGSLEAFLVLRRRLSISFAFHLLSTGFKRGWSCISACMPESCANFQRVLSEYNKRAAGKEDQSGTTECLLQKRLSFLDEDAFMDTFAQWSYPLPRVVVLHCTSAFRSVTPGAVFCGAAPSGLDTLPYDNGGVASFFSIETLCKFTTVHSVEEALERSLALTVSSNIK